MCGYQGQVADKFRQSYGQVEKWNFSRTEADISSVLQECDMDKVIYLSADAEEELTEINDDFTYIIGGIVDRNRHKVHPNDVFC